MSDQHLTDDLLQRFADGDLSAAHAASASQHLEHCTQCTQAHARLQALHRVMLVAANHSAEGVDFEALYRRIERGTREAPEPGLLERLSLWWRELVEHQPGRLLVPAGALAIAAAVIISTRTSDPKPKEILVQRDTTTAQPAQAPSTPDESANALAMASAGSEVVQVDFGDGTGTVYEIALADGVSTPVVWINDEQ